MICIVETNEDGYIKLTKNELEDLLKKAESEGYQRGKELLTYTPISWWPTGTKDITTITY